MSCSRLFPNDVRDEETCARLARPACAGSLHAGLPTSGNYDEHSSAVVAARRSASIDSTYKKAYFDLPPIDGLQLLSYTSPEI